MRLLRGWGGSEPGSERARARETRTGTGDGGDPSEGARGTGMGVPRTGEGKLSVHQRIRREPQPPLAVEPR